MRTIFQTLLFAVFLVAVSSCFEERLDTFNPPSGNGEMEVVLRLNAPGGYSSIRTRALSVADENSLENVYVLVFNKAYELVDIRKGVNVSSNPKYGQSQVSGTGAFIVSLKPSVDNEDQLLLMVIANSESILENSSIGTDFSQIHTPKTYTDVLEALQSEMSRKLFTMSDTHIPMWGETGHMLIGAGNASASVTLIRSIARMDIGVGNPAQNMEDNTYSWDGKDDSGKEIPFELKTVCVVRPNNKYAVIPYVDNFDKGEMQALSPTIPPMTDKYDVSESINNFTYDDIKGTFLANIKGTGNVLVGGYSSQSIYMPESDIKMGSGKSGDNDHTRRMAIVVGGIYKGSNPSNTTITYYRVDVAPANGDLINVLRNHLYQFNIYSVSGPGYNDVTAAYNSLPMNMEVNILEWNETVLDDIIFDGQYYFHINKKDILFSPKGNETQIIEIRTNVPEWTLSKKEGMSKTEVINSTGSGSYNNTEYGFSYTLTRKGDEDYELSVTASRPNVSESWPNVNANRSNVSETPGERLEEFEISANRLQTSLTVKQQSTNFYTSFSDGANQRIYPEGTDFDPNLVTLDIISPRITTVTVDYQDGDNWIHMDDLGYLSQPTGDPAFFNLHWASLKIGVDPYKVTSNDHGFTRKATIIVTPQGDSPRTFEIIQEAPYIILSKSGVINIPRSTPGTFVDYINIVTNILSGSLVTGLNAIDIDPALLKNTDAYSLDDPLNPRYQQFEIGAKVNGGVGIPEGKWGVEYFVSANPALYGSCRATVTYECLADIFSWDWSWKSDMEYDKSTNIIYPWNAAEATLFFRSNMGLVYDDTGSSLTSPVSVGIEKTSDELYTVKASLSKLDQGLLDNYSLKFSTTPSPNNTFTVVFRQGRQYLHRTQLGNNASFGHAGNPQSGGATINITSNVKWKADVETGKNWCQVHIGASGWGNTTSVVDNEPLKTETLDKETYDYTVDWTTISELGVYVQAMTSGDLNNGADTREADITFTNVSDGTTPTTINPSQLRVKQYYPKLSYSSGVPSVPIDGYNASFNIQVQTNLPGWKVVAYEGNLNIKNRPLAVTMSNYQADGIPGTPSPDMAVLNCSAKVDVENNFSDARNVSFYLTSTEFPNPENEIYITTITQNKGSIDFNGHGGWAGSNVYWDGEKLTFDDVGVTDNQQQIGVYFMWGSLVALSSQGDWVPRSYVKGQSGTSGHIIYIPNPDPATNTPGTSNGWNPLDVSQTAWGYIPRMGWGNVTPDQPWGNASSNPAGSSTSAFIPVNRSQSYVYQYHNPNKNIGDICKYITEMNWAPGGHKWRLPTSQEFDSSHGNYFPTGIWGAQTSGNWAGVYTIESYQTKEGAVFPASGFRVENSGNISNVGREGSYWSGSPFEVSGFRLYFGAGPTPESYYYRNSGFSVRCVREK